ncbi:MULTISPECIES: efflux RND transporter periplasmic adaptor subunit [Hyphomicrobiales]|jgi:Cu(I)/Ag(I) efflux system membrane fusion protein|uniref:Efflux RND transporter periplasmic adaptor subunit n=1 Tax=Bosea massiliensis TaxID=151419 RepID=A0ABW0P9R3_9HYPH|nr:MULTISPECIES: efflux RND transporter periplasmic adaptor subunit [Hyphomicrobiales]
MDQVTPFHAFDPADRGLRGRSTVGRLVRLAFVLATVVGALGTGYTIGKAGWPLPSWAPTWLIPMLGRDEGSAPAGSVVFGGGSDGHPVHPAEHSAAGGLDHLPVRTGGDASARIDQSASHAGHGAAAVGSAEPAKKVLYYRNPMGLPDTSPVPKKDSMGMDYVPVYEGEADDGSIVKVSPGKLQRTGVRSQAVERRVVTRPVRAPASVQLDERRVAVVALRSEGFIEKVEPVTTGARVRKGQPLMRLYSPEIAAASAQYLSLVVQPSSSGPLLADGARRRLENLNVPPDVTAEIERTRKVPLTITWPAPRDGVVLERTAIDGMRAPSGDVLFRIADLSLVWVLADVPEHDLGAVRLGQPVTMRTHALPGRSFTGRVDLIYPQVNKETRTTRVRVEIPNPDGVLLPDMYGDVDIATGSDQPVVAVPDSAVIDTGMRQVVILDKGEGRFEPREVKVGARGNGVVEIRQGVAAGDQVVTAANFLIDAESNLKAALQSMVAASEEKPQ